MTDLKPCPFCGGTNLKSGGDDKIVGTWCLDCEATGPNQYGRHEWNDRDDRIKELEAKLATAVEALGTALSEMVDYADTHPAWSEIWEAREAARTTLAELTGGKEK